MTRPLKVLHLLHVSAPLQVGYTLRSHKIIHAQKNMGFDSRAVTPLSFTEELKGQGWHFQPEETVDGTICYRCAPSPWVRVIDRLPSFRGFGVLKSRARRRAERKTYFGRAIAWGPPDLLHAHSPYSNGYWARELSESLGIPYIYEVRGLWEDTFQVENPHNPLPERLYQQQRGFEEQSAKEAARVVAIGERLREDLIERGVDPLRIDVVPNGLDERFLEPVAGQEDLARELGLAKGPVIGLATYFRRLEGVDILLDAAEMLVQSGRKFSLLLVGHGPDHSRIAAEVERRNLAEITVMTGKIAHDAMPRYYSLMDMVVLPRLAVRVTEFVTPLKPLEPMAMGIPLVVSNVGGLTELVEEGKDGLVFPAGNAGGCAECISALLDSGDLRTRLGEHGRQKVAKTRIWPVVVEGYRAVYERALQLQSGSLQSNPAGGSS